MHGTDEKEKFMARKHLLAHLAHVELLTPKLEESVAFFKDVMGLEETTREGDSVYLRCWGDYYHSSLVLTASDHSGLGHGAWRTFGPEELEGAVAAIEAAGQKGEWIESSPGHGRAYRFKGPGGHVHEVFWEVERFQAPEGRRSTFPERPERRGSRGVSPRQLDHLTVAVRDIMGAAPWYRDTLGFRWMAYNQLDNGPVVFSVLTTNEKSHDLGMGIDFSPIPGRLHHLAFWLDTTDELLIAADRLLEAGTPIEFGPGKHGIGEQNYLYFREPGGNRIEMNTGGYRNYVPDWEPVAWKISQGSNVMYRNLDMPDSMLEAMPPAPEGAVGEPEMVASGQIGNPWAGQTRT
jgi:catechol 2,3-dioxygenase